MQEDFVEASECAKDFMKAERGGRMAGVFSKYGSEQKDNATGAEPVPEGEVIYLTSDSPNTLDELKPYSTYIIGGLVDKNRHKGICYKTACDRGIKTAKLPIGQYMEMQSRFVLATNHVVEIMVRWLDCGDWGEAFLQVIPKRKGGKLKQDKNEVEIEAAITNGGHEDDDSEGGGGAITGDLEGPDTELNGDD